MGDDQALNRQFLARAKALSEQPEVFRCVAVTQLIGDTVAFGVRSEAEVFQAVYGDPDGRKYWEAHLSEAIPAAKLAHLLAVHLAENAERLSVWKSAILLAIRDAAEAGERWFIGEAAPQPAVNYDPTNFEGIYKAKIHPRPAVEWLLSKPKREHLVPESLRQHLRPRQRHTITNANTKAKSARARRRRRGPTPGEIDRHAVSDRALFPDVKRLVDESHKSVHAAALELALAGKTEGVGTPESRAKRLAKRFRKERL